jgi:hypothetical protein
LPRRSPLPTAFCHRPRGKGQLPSRSQLRLKIPVSPRRASPPMSRPHSPDAKPATAGANPAIS